MFETCMLLAFLCAGLCHLLPPQPPPSRGSGTKISQNQRQLGQTRIAGKSRPPSIGSLSPLGPGVPANRRFQ